MLACIQYIPLLPLPGTTIVLVQAAKKLGVGGEF